MRLSMALSSYATAQETIEPELRTYTVTCTWHISCEEFVHKFLKPKYICFNASSLRDIAEYTLRYEKQTA